LCGYNTHRSKEQTHTNASTGAEIKGEEENVLAGREKWREHI